MTNTMKKTIALLLVLVQLFVLFPVLQPEAKAAEDELPALNPVIEGTVRFGSFNYLGDKGTDAAGDERDGVDYVTTFYYSDDFFSRSAVNPNATRKTMDWTDLEDLSMATLSEKFTVAVYGSSENTFPTVWTNKDKNGKRFLTDCGFTNLFTSAEFNQQTGKDTLGYMFGTKQITVWDQKTEQNKTFTLVAVGVRGGGYGAEWGSNLKIGDKTFVSSHNKSYSGTYRHQGFDEGAQKVLTDLRSYTQNMTGDVKYWVVGFSRSGAIANLVAGDITKNASTYKTSIDDVYGYTFEAAAGALKSEDPNGTTYPNIHNIVNPMDAVPRVSPALFNHGRLGVDYRLPYHGNTTANDNTTYYTNMRKVLPMVAKIADIYNKSYTGKENDKYEDAVITDSDPATYPYNRTIQMKSFGITNFNNGFVSNVSNANSKIAPARGWYLDEFLDAFVTAFINSRAWDAPFFRQTTFGWNADNMKRNDWQSHEKNYVEAYQEALRTLAGDALKNPGMGLGALDGIMDKAMGALDFNTILSGGNLLTQYAAMNLTGGGWGYESSVGRMISPMTYVLNRIIDEVGLFNTEDLNEVHSAISTIMPALTWLYCDDHTYSNGEYLGTVFANVGTILVTHIPELGMSWLMSLDDIFTSDYREITLPKATAVSMYVFRPGIDDEFVKSAVGVEANADAQGQLVASVVNGTVVNSKDARISAAVSDENVTIRYPGNLDLRLDVTPMEQQNFDDMLLSLADYAPSNVVNVKSDCNRATTDSTNYNISNIVDTTVVKDNVMDHTSYTMTSLDNTEDATAINNLSTAIDIPMTSGETLHLMTWHGSNQLERQAETTYDVSLDRAPNTIVADYSSKTVLSENAASVVENTDGFALKGEQLVWTAPANMSGGSSISNAALLGNTYSAVSETKATDSSIKTRQTQIVVPASSIYFDDEMKNGDSSYVGDTTRLDSSTEAKTVWYKFRGTRIDAYCTTDDTAGYVQAAVTDESGNIVTNAAGERMIVTMKSASDTTRYNVPTISFDGLDPNTDYYFKIMTLKGANYRLDGIRVYHSADETDSAVAAAYDAVSEQDAKYVNLRALLLGSISEETLSGDDANIAEGALFYTDSGTSYALTSDEYVANSPKNEIYLKSGESVAFQIVGSYEKIAVGMSAPNTKTGGGSVTVTNGEGTKTQPVANALDQYYSITPAPDGSVMITNSGSTMISITNVKLSGDYTEPVTGQSLEAPLMVSKSLVRYAASFSALPDTTPEEPEIPEETPAPTEDPVVTPTPELTPTPAPTPAPTPTPTNPSSDSGVMQLISSFVRSLFGGFSRLFRP